MIKSEYRSEYELSFRVVWYYYMEEYTQTEIAEKLNITRNAVIKILKDAKKKGLVTFHVNKDHDFKMRLEQSLIEKYRLQDVFIVPEVDSEKNINESIAKAAANYIYNNNFNSNYINIGYGDTLNRLLNYFATISDDIKNIVSLTGGVSYYLPNAKYSYFNAIIHLIPSPFVLKDKNLRDALLEDTSVSSIINMTSFSNVSVIGIGSVSSEATIVKNGLLTQSDMEVLKMRGAVGDILSHFIDENGELVDNNLEDRIISTPLEKLKELNNVIAVAGGQNKVQAIKAALKGNYIDILITDERTARSLL